ncbi:hypothetical protein BT63DRAFT_200826 [Microthyrium microscopicum]|uniref:Transcription factor domain-containing protein n=1 Tax=Microthyrium microscopicum TaxID=703497 RepID=A0A6A6UER6_9PEZI|nr:hypothetical protein BT63DRAFT_200826 [Microthyrium microscopicum]
MISNNCIDPFFKPPAPLKAQELEALDHIYRGSFHPFVTMRGCGLLSRTRETVAFFQLLSFSSWHLAILRNNGQFDCSLQCAAKARQKLKDQICDPNTSITVDLILAVLSFANSAAQMRDPDTAKVHIDGAQRMMRHRDGIRSLESDAWAWALLFWIETVSCSFTDLPTRCPAPIKYLAWYKRSNNQISQWIETNVVNPMVSIVFNDAAAVRAINAIREVQIMIRSEASKRDISQDAFFASNHILPIFHDLLAMLDHERSVHQEAFRLAAMEFLHGLQRSYCGRIPPSLFLDKLYHLLSTAELNWSLPDPTLVWIIAVALTSDTASPEHITFYLYRFRLLCATNMLTNFNKVMQRLDHVSWDIDILKRRTELLRYHFERVYSSCSDFHHPRDQSVIVVDTETMEVDI